MYVKPIDRHKYLHPKHTKRSAVFNQTLHATRICSCEYGFHDHYLHMRPWFLKRENLGKLVDNEMKKVNYFPANLQNKTLEKWVMLFVT